MVAAIRALRMSMSEGRTSPAIAASASTWMGPSVPVSAMAVMRAARAA